MGRQDGKTTWQHNPVKRGTSSAGSYRARYPTTTMTGTARTTDSSQMGKAAISSTRSSTLTTTGTTPSSGAYCYSLAIAETTWPGAAPICSTTLLRRPWASSPSCTFILTTLVDSTISCTLMLTRLGLMEVSGALFWGGSKNYEKVENCGLQSCH